MLSVGKSASRENLAERIKNVPIVPKANGTRGIRQVRVRTLAARHQAPAPRLQMQPPQRLDSLRVFKHCAMAG
jgi:hypothetical protein